MQYRALPKEPDTTVPILGFGCMRLPVVDRDPARIDEDRAEPLIRSAIARGVTHLDTAYPYHGGNSEPFVGRLLRGGLREQVRIASKLPIWLVKTEADFERLLDEQLKRLETDWLDFYMFHGLSAERWETVRRLRGLEAFERARADGRIRRIGFSFHGSPDAFATIVDAYDWDFTQIQYNYMDEEYQAGRRGLDLAAGKGLGVIVMEPVRGGALARNVPPQVAAVWEEAPVRRSPAEWALQWVWNVPEVSFLLSGMSTMQHVEDDLEFADRSRPGLLTAAELALVARVRDLYRELSPIPCTSCRYCMPCPQGVAIPDIFELYDDAHIYDDLPRRRMSYDMFLDEGERADQCTACGDCLDKCPQGIDIPTWMEKAQAFLAG